MNATSIIKDLQYILDKKNQYLQHCKEAEKDCKALEIELATLNQAKELLEELLYQQQEAKKQLDEAKATTKNAEQALLIAEAVQAEYNSAVYWQEFSYASKLMFLQTNPKIVIDQWLGEIEVQESNLRVAKAAEQRLDYFNAKNRELYESWCKSTRIDYKKREPVWRQMWVIKNSENHA